MKKSLQAQKDMILDQITTLHLTGTRAYLIMKDDIVVEAGYKWISDDYEESFNLANKALTYVETLLRGAEYNEKETRILL